MQLEKKTLVAKPAKMRHHSMHDPILYGPNDRRPDGVTDLFTAFDEIETFDLDQS